MPGEFDRLRSDEDVEEILKLAVRGGGFEGDSLRERLQNSARELGLSEEAVRRAEEQYYASQASAANLATEAEDRKLFRRMKVGELINHAASYVAVNAFLLWIDWRDGRLSWCYWVAMSWGIGMAIHAFNLVGHSFTNEDEFQRWRARRHKRSRATESANVDKNA